MATVKTKYKVKKSKSKAKTKYYPEIDYSQDHDLECVLSGFLGKSTSQANKERLSNLLDGYLKVNEIQVITDKKDFYEFLISKKHTLDDIKK